MMCSAVLQTQISAIMDVLAKAAVAEIGQLLEEDAAALHHEIRRREEEIRGLKTRLQMTERKLQRAAADRRSIGLQVEMWDACVSADSQEDIYAQEENIATSPVKELSEVKPWLSHAPEMIRPVKPSTDPPRAHQLSRDEEFSGLEFEMKIEQVEEFVDQKLNQAQEEQRSIDGNSDLWLSGEPDKAFDDSENRSDSEQRSQNFTNHVAQVLMEDPMSSQSAHSLFGAGVVLDNENYNGVTPENKDVEYGFQKDPLNLLTATQQDSHRQTPTHSGTSLTDSTVFSRVQCLYSSSAVPKTLTTSHTQSLYVGDPQQHSAGSKTFRCEECGKDFTQRTRLRTHRLVHTGEKPFRCQLCGKTFSRQDNCLRHLRLHSGQHSQLDRYLP